MGTWKCSVLPIFPCLSGSSPRVPNKSYYITKIKDQAKSVGIGDLDANLEALSNYISQYLEFIQHRRERPSKPNAAKSDFLFKLKDMVVEGGEAFKAYFPDAKSIVQQSFQGLGATHILATGFLLVANIMDRCDKIRQNREVCLSLLEEMTRLVQEVKKLRDRRRLREGLKIQIEKAVGLIIEVSLACCNQIKQPGCFHFFSTTVNQQALLDFQTRLTKLRDQITRHMDFAVFDLVEKGPTPLPRVSDEFIQENRVHIEKVIELLEWKSNEKAVAVVLYGLGGIGKTTLADAVYSRLCGENTEACKNSYVRLFEKITDSPNIKELQTQILQNLMEPPIPEIRRCDIGRNQIESILQKEVVFIYIDGVLFPEVGQGLNEVEELLPMATEKVRKLRLLITARDKGAARRAFNKLRIQTKFYHIETLPDTRAMELVQKQLNERLVSSQISQERLNSNQISQIVQICGGIPRLLMEVAESEKYVEKLREAPEEFRAGSIVKEIDGYVFAHEYLDKDLKDPFFDICLYFEAWDWEELSNIVGKTQLKGLEDMALVTKDFGSMTAKVHNVILAIGLHYKGERFKFTNASEFQEILDKRAEDLEKIKGIWASDISGPLVIPASKLDLMRKSLRVLALGNSTEVNDQCTNEFDELYFFSAPGISHLPFVPSRLKKLRHLCGRFTKSKSDVL